MGASGLMMTLQVLGTSTSRIALRLTFFRFDFDPKVATSLLLSMDCVGKEDLVAPYQTVATPLSRDVRTTST